MRNFPIIRHRCLLQTKSIRAHSSSTGPLTVSILLSPFQQNHHLPGCCEQLFWVTFDSHPTPHHPYLQTRCPMEVPLLRYIAFPHFFSLCIVAFFQKHALASKPQKHHPDSLPVLISPGCQCWFLSKVHFYSSMSNIIPRLCVNMFLNTGLSLRLSQLLIPQWCAIPLCILWTYFITLVNKKASLVYGMAEYT